MGPFFEAAARSVTRQAVFRQMAAIQALIIGAAIAALASGRVRNPVHVIGFTLLIAGIVEGALLLGWRLTQWPKSKALELILISPLTPRWAMVGEQAVGCTLFLLVVGAAAPMLAMAIGVGWLSPWEAFALAIMAATWGGVTGFGLTWWAYEPLRIRRIGEKIAMAGILIYLIVGGLAGERTPGVLQAWLPAEFAAIAWRSFKWLHEDTPFALIYRMGLRDDPDVFRSWCILETIGLFLIGAFMVRAAWRLLGHYLERHYVPHAVGGGPDRGVIGDQPLTWHAVRRVSEYSGRINLWLAWGAVALYSAFLIAGDRWPSWLGRGVFGAFEALGGPAGLTTVLVLLAGVPAAYQYGLWDSSIPERCKKLELLLLTNLSVGDYLQASLRASWHRGKGYFLAALLLASAALLSQRATPQGALLGFAASVALLALYAAVGFRFLAFSTGSTVVGFFLSLGLPLFNWSLGAAGRKELASLLPPGLIYFGLADGNWSSISTAAFVGWTVAAIWLLWRSLVLFDGDLRGWYERNQGRKT